MNQPSLTQWLLPNPKHISQESGVCRLSNQGPLQIELEDQRIHRAALRWRQQTGLKSAMTIRVDKGLHPNTEAYRLRIQPTEIELLATTPTGCYWGLQTLTQLTDLSARFSNSARDSAHLELPCCTILDWPDMSVRGVLHDVTRGKVPTVSTLKLLVDRLSSLKVNQLQLYIEHAFTFSFDPDICGTEEGLTPDEIAELHDHCTERFMDLVPALATFGHMGRVLSMPKYRHLAEIEPTQSWQELSWPARARGFTLDCLNPESHRLVERMWSDVLDAFPGPTVNICGDEPWDLGKGKNSERLKGPAKYRAYVEQLERTQRICAARGRRTQFWSDVIRAAPQLDLSTLKDSTVLHWGYDDRSDYNGTTDLVQQGFTTIVCPGTTGWKRILNAMNLAERNIRDFTAAARSAGAIGLITTDWGDHGHFNPLSGSWHAFALGAALAWDNFTPAVESFDKAFSRWFFKRSDPDLVRNLRQMAKLSDVHETWKHLWCSLSDLKQNIPSISTELLVETIHYSNEARLNLTNLLGSASIKSDNRIDFEELSSICDFSALLCRRLLWLQPLPNQRPSTANEKAWLDELKSSSNRYSDCWRLRNKPFGLKDILSAVRATADEVAGLCG